MEKWSDLIRKRASALKIEPVLQPAPPPVQAPVTAPVALVEVVAVHADGSADVRLLTCRGCHQPLDGAGRCWRCHDRLCQVCRRAWTASAFISRCRSCEVAEARAEGLHL